MSWARFGKSWTLAMAAWMLATLAAAPALAQVDAERFKPALGYDGWLGAEGSAVRHPDDPWELGAWLNYAHRPLVSVAPDGTVTRHFVSHRLGVDAVASFSLGERFALAAGLPLYVLQAGDGGPSLAGLGDLRLGAKYTLLSDVQSGIGIGLLVEGRLPTHTGDFAGGARTPQLIPKVAVDHRYASGVRVGFNIGVAVRESSTFLNVDAGSELAYAAALGYRFGGIGGRTEIGVELAGGLGLTASDSEEVALEALGYLRHALGRQWEISVAAGPGLLEGYGVPSMRALLGVRFTPTAHDRDHDGVSDSVDSCPDDPEDRDGEEDGDGCPEEDADSDQDGVADVDDDCPDAKETINGVSDEDGCPDSGDPRVIYDDGQFIVLDNIRFEHGSSQITPGSTSLLDQVALTLKAHPEIGRMRVEGHTDDTGPRNVNMRLSEERAHAVRRYLIRKGVSPSRLRVLSHGPDRPIVEGTDAEARAKNRRVEFVLE